MNAGAFDFQSFGKAFKVFEDRVDAVLREERNGVLGVLVEVGIEDALIHEVGFRTDGKRTQRR